MSTNSPNRLGYARLRNHPSFRAALRVSARVKPLHRLLRRLTRRLRQPGPGSRPNLTGSPVGAPRGPKGPGSDSKPARAAALAAARRAVPVSVPAQSEIDAELDRLERLAARPAITIIVPIFNAYDELRSCVASLERNTDARNTDLLLIDDCSTDDRVSELLDEMEQLDGVRVLRNDENLGFTRTVNRGFAATTGDVVILNSDCEVTPRWLQNLADGAYRNPRAATVTAVSDNAGAFSVPQIGVANDRPRHLSSDDVGRLVTRTSERIFPTGPTGNGFCMYIKRAALDEVGPFDAESFPRGYGEEGDFCMRAREAGWVNVVDDATIVFHHRSASFGETKDALIRAGRAKLDERHPDYTAAVRTFVTSDELQRVQANVQTAYDGSVSLRRRIRPRILYVHHRGTGGTPETNADLMGALVEDYEPYLLTSDTNVVELSRFDADGTELLERWSLGERLDPEQFSNPRYRAIVASILTRYGIDLVHIRLLLAHTFDLPSVARILDIPVVLSFHDFYLVCPTVHLLDNNDQFCAGVCTAGDGSCRIPSDWVKGVPHLKHEWVNVWQAGVSRMIADVDAFVTTSAAAREIYVRTYPELSDAPFHLIEHGRDLGSEPVLTSPDLRSPVRIVVPGALDVHKGATFIEELVRADTAERLEFHFIGKVPEQFRHLGVMHGPYARDEFAAKMREIRPAFVGILSIWAETYSHTLSEAWASGLPVLVTDLGAPRERVEQNGGGWILDHRDPARAYARILEICDDETEYRRVCAEVGPGGTRPLRAMASDYDRLYRSTLIGHRALRRPDVPKPPRVRRAALFLPGGSDGAHTGRARPSSHIRMLRRLGYPLVRRELATDALDVEDFVDGLVDEPDVVIVQRTGVPPGLLDGFLETVTASAVPLVVDLDDNLFALEPGEGSYAEYGHHITSLERLIGAADLVTLSTESLRDAIEPRARRVVVVPNMLDEFLWFGDARAASVPKSRLRRASAPGRRWIGAALRRGRSAPRTCNLVYMGTPTHADDLALLRPVMQRLRSRHDVDIRLFVVGGEDPPAGGSPGRPWYERVELPRKCSPYAAFVPWLRGASRSWDVAVAPLRDTAFNRCKSDLKFLEYAALGLPGIYSNVIPYSPSVEHEQTGLLVENTVDAWCAAILRFAHDPELRKRTAARAKEYVLAGRCLEHQADDYVRLLREVSASSTGAAG